MKKRITAAVATGLLAITLTASPAAAYHDGSWNPRNYVCNWLPAICR